MGKWQRPQQKRIEETEHRRICTNAQRKREHGDQSETGILQQLAKGKF
jgi:hypothetical protein